MAFCGWPEQWPLSPRSGWPTILPLLAVTFVSLTGQASVSTSVKQASEVLLGRVPLKAHSEPGIECMCLFWGVQGPRKQPQGCLQAAARRSAVPRGLAGEGGAVPAAEGSVPTQGGGHRGIRGPEVGHPRPRGGASERPSALCLVPRQRLWGRAGWAGQNLPEPQEADSETERHGEEHTGGEASGGATGRRTGPWGPRSRSHVCCTAGQRQRWREHGVCSSLRQGGLRWVPPTAVGSWLVWASGPK